MAGLSLKLVASSEREVADGLDVVAVGVADKGGEVVVVVLRPEARLMEHLGPHRHSGGEEPGHSRTVGRGERHMGFPEAVVGGPGPIQNDPGLAGTP